MKFGLFDRAITVFLLAPGFAFAIEHPPGRQFSHFDPFQALEINYGASTGDIKRQAENLRIRLQIDHQQKRISNLDLKMRSEGVQCAEMMLLDPVARALHVREIRQLRKAEPDATSFYGLIPVTEEFQPTQDRTAPSDQVLQKSWVATESGPAKEVLSFKDWGKAWVVTESGLKFQINGNTAIPSGVVIRMDYPDLWEGPMFTMAVGSLSPREQEIIRTLRNRSVLKHGVFREYASLTADFVDGTSQTLLTTSNDIWGYEQGPAQEMLFSRPESEGANVIDIHTHPGIQHIDEHFGKFGRRGVYKSSAPFFSDGDIDVALGMKEQKKIEKLRTILVPSCALCGDTVFVIDF